MAYASVDEVAAFGGFIPDTQQTTFLEKWLDFFADEMDAQMRDEGIDTKNLSDLQKKYLKNASMRNGAKWFYTYGRDPNISSYSESSDGGSESASYFSAIEDSDFLKLTPGEISSIGLIGLPFTSVRIRHSWW